MKKELKDFIDKKSNINYEYIDEHNVYPEVHKKQMNDYFKRIFSNTYNRDFIVATSEEQVVGIAILFKRYDSGNRTLDNVITLSNIEVDEEYKNEGIGTELLSHVTDHCKKNNFILLRTTPTEEGQSFIFDKFSEMLKDNNVEYIPDNLSFIYSDLENEIFKDKNYDNKEKVNMMYDVAEKLLKNKHAKEYNLKISTLSNSFLDESREIISKIKDKSKTKQRKRIN